MCAVSRLPNKSIFAASLTIVLTSLGIYLYPARLAGDVGFRADVHQVRQLQEERVATLRKIVDLVDQRRGNGGASMAELVWAKRNVSEAELEICVTQTERVLILEKIVAEAKALESQAAQLAQNNIASQEVALAMKADLLHSRVRLELARAELSMDENMNSCGAK